MDWVVNAELQFPAYLVESLYLGNEPSDAMAYAKECLEKLVKMGQLTYYHILSSPRLVET